MVSNPFWRNVIDSLKILWNYNFALDRSIILETPLWLNPVFKLQINREWKEKGIMVISDFIEYSKKLYSMADFIARYKVKTNFLEYARVSIKINEYLNWRDTPDYREPRPKNSFLNSILSADIKGLSNLYKLILPKGNQILGELTDKWSNRAY